jgi:hypothetical protein
LRALFDLLPTPDRNGRKRNVINGFGSQRVCSSAP